MVWNHLLQILAGILANSLFTFSYKGILSAAFVTGMIQLVDTIRIYFYHRNLALKSPDYILEKKLEIFKKGAIYKLSQLFVIKVIWYGFITLLAAALTRYFYFR